MIRLNPVVRKILVVFIVFLCFWLLFKLFTKVVLDKEYKIITTFEEVDRLYRCNNPKYLFIDLRERKEYEKAHIDKYVNIPFSKENQDTLLKFLKQNHYKDKTLILMCYSSKRASEAFNLLYEKGYPNLYVINISINDMLSKYTGKIAMGGCNCLK